MISRIRVKCESVTLLVNRNIMIFFYNFQMNSSKLISNEVTSESWQFITLMKMLTIYLTQTAILLCRP